MNLMMVVFFIAQLITGIWAMVCMADDAHFHGVIMLILTITFFVLGNTEAMNYANQQALIETIQKFDYKEPI